MKQLIFILSFLFLPFLALSQTTTDARLLVENEQLAIQIRNNIPTTLEGFFSNIIITISYSNGYGTLLKDWETFGINGNYPAMLPVVKNGDRSYQTLVYFGMPWSKDECKISFPSWTTIARADIDGTDQTLFSIGDDDFTRGNNLDFFISVNGYNSTGFVGDDVPYGSDMMTVVNYPGNHVLLTGMKEGDKLTMMDMAGRMISTLMIDLNGDVMLDLDQYGKGLYLIMLERDGRRLVKKVVVG